MTLLLILAAIAIAIGGDWVAKWHREMDGYEI